MDSSASRATAMASPAPQGETTITEFHQFLDLPPELRNLIWEFYFKSTSTRIHVCQQLPNQSTLQMYTLDAGTNRHISHPIISLINREAHGEARLLQWQPSRHHLAEPIPTRSLVPHLAWTRDYAGYADVDWERDLVLVAAPPVRLVVPLLFQASWGQDVRQLAVTVPEETYGSGSGSSSAAATRPVQGCDVDCILRSLTLLPNLRAVYLVYVPREPAIVAAAGSTALGRDRFGFADWESFYREVRDKIEHCRDVWPYRRLVRIVTAGLSRCGIERTIEVKMVVDTKGCWAPGRIYIRQGFRAGEDSAPASSASP